MAEGLKPRCERVSILTMCRLRLARDHMEWQSGATFALLEMRGLRWPFV